MLSHLSNPQQRPTGLALILVASCLFNMPAPAQAAKDCNVFAAAAMTRANENVQFGCGFADTRYALNQAGHFNWCNNAAVSEAQINAELNFRRDQIEGCKAKKASLEAGCKSFAEQTVQKARLNVQLGCGLKGGDFADDYNGHFQWCMSHGQSAASHQNSKTNMMIDACKASKAEVKKNAENHAAMCRNFAQSAVLKAREARKLNCGYNTGDYADDYAGHYTWCLSASAQQAIAQNQKTNNGIDSCRAKQ